MPISKVCTYSIIISRIVWLYVSHIRGTYLWWYHLAIHSNIVSTIIDCRPWPIFVTLWLIALLCLCWRNHIQTHSILLAFSKMSSPIPSQGQRDPKFDIYCSPENILHAVDFCGALKHFLTSCKATVMVIVLEALFIPINSRCIKG